MRTCGLEIRLSNDEYELDSAAAMAVGETLSEFFRHAASARAQEILSDQHRIALSDDEAARFFVAQNQPDDDTVIRLRSLRQGR